MGSLTEDELRLLQYNDAILADAYDHESEARSLLDKTDALSQSVKRDLKLNVLILCCLLIVMIVTVSVTIFMNNSYAKNAATASQPRANQTR